MSISFQSLINLFFLSFLSTLHNFYLLGKDQLQYSDCFMPHQWRCTRSVMPYVTSYFSFSFFLFFFLSIFQRLPLLFSTLKLKRKNTCLKVLGRIRLSYKPELFVSFFFFRILPYICSSLDLRYCILPLISPFRIHIVIIFYSLFINSQLGILGPFVTS